MDNSLKTFIYEKVYKGDKKKFFSFSTEDVTQEVLNVLDWTGLRVLEIGCGIVGYSRSMVQPWTILEMISKLLKLKTLVGN